MAVYRRKPLIPPKIDPHSRISDSDEWINSGEWVLVRSSNVNAIRYDYVNRWLYVEFGGKPNKRGGTSELGTYVYYGVPPEVAKWMFEAQSMGKYVHQVLKKDRYRYSKIS